MGPLLTHLWQSLMPLKALQPNNFSSLPWRICTCARHTHRCLRIRARELLHMIHADRYSGQLQSQ